LIERDPPLKVRRSRFKTGFGIQVSQQETHGCCLGISRQRSSAPADAFQGGLQRLDGTAVLE